MRPRERRGRPRVPGDAGEAVTRRRPKRLAPISAAAGAGLVDAAVANRWPLGPVEETVRTATISDAARTRARSSRATGPRSSAPSTPSRAGARSVRVRSTVDRPSPLPRARAYLASMVHMRPRPRSRRLWYRLRRPSRRRRRRRRGRRRPLRCRPLGGSKPPGGGADSPHQTTRESRPPTGRRGPVLANGADLRARDRRRVGRFGSSLLALSADRSPPGAWPTSRTK